MRREARNPRRMTRSAKDRRRAFTLVELMVVVGALGVLVSMAVPGVQRYVWKAQRAEAMSNLTGIYQAQVKYYSDFGRYADNFTELRYRIFGGRMVDQKTIATQYYTYTLDAFPNLAGEADGNFQAIATGDRDPSDAMLDVLMIENGITIVD